MANAKTRNNGESVANIERAEKSGATKAKFEDILNVSNVTDCQNISIDLDSFSDDINVNGSLCKPESVQFFKKLGASDYIIKTLTDGHYSTFTNDVPSYERRNNKSFYEHEEFAVNDILELIKKGKVEVLNSKPHIVNPLSVAVQRNKLWFILDCSYVNQFVDVPKFKYEDVKEALQSFKKGCSMIKWDLKNGYHMIRIHKDFCFTYKGKTIYAQYTIYLLA